MGQVIQDLPTAPVASVDGFASPPWQRLALIGVAASAAIFVVSSVWQMLGFLGPVLSLFFGGWLLASLLEPLVGWLVRRARAPRATAVLATYCAILVAGATVWVVAAPMLAGQVSTSITSLPAQVDVAGQRAVDTERVVNASLDEHGVSVHVDVASRLSLNNLAQLLRVQLEPAMASPLTVAGAAFGVLGNLGMMLLLSVFFLLGGDQLAERVVRALPTRAAPDARFVFDTVQDAFENYVRASLLEGILFASGVWACLAAVHVDTAPLVGLAAGVLLLVPVLGAVLAVLMPVVATLLWNPTATPIVAVALVLLEQLVLNVLGPRLMSKQLGLPPLLVFFGVLAGGQLAGVWGAVFGIPVLAALLACVEHFRSRA